MKTDVYLEYASSQLIHTNQPMQFPMGGKLTEMSVGAWIEQKGSHLEKILKVEKIIRLFDWLLAFNYLHIHK